VDSDIEVSKVGMAALIKEDIVRLDISVRETGTDTRYE
jgi:hypothetical protein